MAPLMTLLLFCLTVVPSRLRHHNHTAFISIPSSSSSFFFFWYSGNKEENQWVVFQFLLIALGIFLILSIYDFVILGPFVFKFK